MTLGNSRSRPNTLEQKSKLVGLQAIWLNRVGLQDGMSDLLWNKIQIMTTTAS